MTTFDYADLAAGWQSACLGGVVLLVAGLYQLSSLKNICLSKCRTPLGGMWVSPYEVEEVLSEDESVVECAVVGAPDRDTLIKPEAFVVLANDGGGQELEDRLRQPVRQRLGGNKTP